MRCRHRLAKAARAAAVLSIALLPAFAARADDYGPDHAAAALHALPGWRCAMNLGCPISGDAYTALTKALDGDAEAQFKLAELLQRGDGIARDRRAATGWYGKAAEQGHVAAALELNRLRHDGADIAADETRITAALALAVAKGDRDAMRALADMRIYGRGGPRDAAEGIALLRRAVAAGSYAAAHDLANLYLNGAPGIEHDRAKGFRWMARAARLGDAAAVFDLGSMYLNTPDAAARDPAEGYRWLMRAALSDNFGAQEMLSGLLADGAMAGARTVIAPDPVAADMWLRLAARSPYHDNASLRLRVEKTMTTDQLAEAKKRAEAWQATPLALALEMAIALPSGGGAKRPWPPGLHGRALDRFKETADDPPAWMRLPDFTRNDDVMAAITAIAAHCDGAGNARCAATCRQQLDYVAPPVKLGGMSSEELARFLQEHPEVSAVRAMRKDAATPDQSMHFWVLCANGIDSGF